MYFCKIIFQICKHQITKKMTELKDIRLSEGMTAEEYLLMVPEQYKKLVISATYEVLRKGYPMNTGEIERLVRENCGK